MTSRWTPRDGLTTVPYASHSPSGDRKSLIPSTVLDELLRRDSWTMLGPDGGEIANSSHSMRVSTCHLVQIEED